MDYHRHLEEQKLIRLIENDQKIEMIKQMAPTVKPRVSVESPE